MRIEGAFIYGAARMITNNRNVGSKIVMAFLIVMESRDIAPMKENFT